MIFQMADAPPEELLGAIAAGRALIICGAGVSKAATNDAAPIWTALIEDGVKEASRLFAADDQDWAEACRVFLRSKKTDSWLRAADIIQEKLGGFGGGNYYGFFNKELSGLKNTKPELLQALAKLAAAKNPIATTNYDHLISHALRCDRVDWINHVGVVEVLRGKRQAVWHIHGDYDRPESVIFSKADYHRIAQSEFFQSVLKSAGLNFTLVFVGCSGSGLGDDNVGALLNWLQKGFAGLGDQHYVLITDNNADTWPAEVRPIRFGDYPDLPAFLERLAPAAPAPPSVASFPVDPKMIGRKDRLAELVEAILTRAEPILVPGALGMGKTTLAVAACHDRAVIERFGASQRFFVNLEPVPNAEGVLRALANALGLDPSGAASALELAIGEACAARPALAILDNLETPWRGQRVETEAVLERIAAVPGLHLIVTVRGALPFIRGGSFALRDIEQLNADEARQLFLRYAGSYLGADRALPGLLAALDGHPLSIELLAANAAGKANLAGLAADWRTRSAKILERGSAGRRLDSLRASLEISLAALGESSAAYRLLRLIALLPVGMTGIDCVELLKDGAPSDEETAAAATLETARLASRRDDRWHLLAPVREVLRRDFPPEPKDKARLLALFLSRAALGERIGSTAWDAVREAITAEAGNFDATIGVAVEEAVLPDGLLNAARGLAKFHQYTGLGSVASLNEACARIGKAGDTFGEADCTFYLGDVAFQRSDYAAASAKYEKARKLFQSINNVYGEANCIVRLGEIALARSDHQAAREKFEEALPRFQTARAKGGEANCIYRLGDIAIARAEWDGARANFEKALPLYREADDPLGEANCTFRLGEIALGGSHRETARKKFEEALPLYQKIGNVLGEAGCINGLGGIALEGADYPTARAKFEQAASLYKKIGDVSGEASCIRGFGDLEFARTDYAVARASYEQALPLFRKVGGLQNEGNCIQRLGEIDERQGDMASAQRHQREALELFQRIPLPYSVGWTHVALARLESNPAEAAAHREAARQAWSSIARPELIAKYLDGNQQAAGAAKPV